MSHNQHNHRLLASSYHYMYADHYNCSLDKNLNIAGNKVVIAEHKTTKQKFVVTKLKKNDTLTPEDFETGKASEKITDLANKFQYKMVKLENFKIVALG